jgi:hypothetical protein
MQEGWAPSTFKSSRSERASAATQQQQRPEDFMDEDERAALAATSLGVKVREGSSWLTTCCAGELGGSPSVQVLLDRRLH